MFSNFFGNNNNDDEPQNLWMENVTTPNEGLQGVGGADLTKASETPAVGGMTSPADNIPGGLSTSQPTTETGVFTPSISPAESSSGPVGPTQDSIPGGLGSVTVTPEGQNLTPPLEAPVSETSGVPQFPPVDNVPFQRPEQPVPSAEGKGMTEEQTEAIVATFHALRDAQKALQTNFPALHLSQESEGNLGKEEAPMKIFDVSPPSSDMGSNSGGTPGGSAPGNPGAPTL